MRFRPTYLAALAALAIPSTAHAAIDGKVAGLNQPVFDALAAIKQRNPGSLTERDGKELAAAILADGAVDPAERDLLEEMTQSQFRNITVSPAGNPAAKAMTFPAVGNAKKALQNVLDPQLDLGAAWAQGAPGWRDICTEYRKSPAAEMRVLAFVQGKLADQWETSNLGNSYKPLRDEIARLYGYSNSAGADTDSGRAILYKAMSQMDRNANDAVPDFLYNWLRPGGTN